MTANTFASTVLTPMSTAESLPQSVRVTKLRIKVLSVPQPQYQIAALAGIHPSTMSGYVKGTRDILPDHLIALCDLFGCEPEEIMGWVDASGFYGEKSTPGSRYLD